MEKIVQFSQSLRKPFFDGVVHCEQHAKDALVIPKTQTNPYQNHGHCGLIWFGIMEINLVLLLLMDSQVFQPVTFAHLEDFRATISGTPFVHSKAQVQVPWHLIMHHRACLGERAFAYSWSNRDYGRSR